MAQLVSPDHLSHDQFTTIDSRTSLCCRASLIPGTNPRCLLAAGEFYDTVIASIGMRCVFAESHEQRY